MRYNSIFAAILQLPSDQRETKLTTVSSEGPGLCGLPGGAQGLGWAGLGDSSCHQIQEIGQENKKYFPIHLAGYFKQL